MAALLCAVSLGLGWEASRSSLGYQTPGLLLPTTQISPVSGDLITGSHYYPGSWVAGDPMRTQRGFRSDVRVVLVPAAVILMLVSQRLTDSTLRLARATLVALAIVGVQALGRGMVASALVVAMALALAGPIVASPWLRWFPYAAKAPRLET